MFNNEYNKNKKLKKELEKLNYKYNELKKQDTEQIENLKYTYDCSFTKTYNIVELVEGYISEVPEYSYIIVDEFQSHYLKTLRIPSTLKKNLKEKNYYEITYTLKGTTKEILNNIDYINNNISSGENYGFNITIKINETNKTGLEQINEEICSYQK